MSTYKITSIDTTGAVVEIDFDNIEFDGYDAKGKKAKVSTQAFKFDGLRMDTAENFLSDVETAVAQKIAELQNTEPNPDIFDLVGTTKEVESVSTDASE